MTSNLSLKKGKIFWIFIISVVWIIIILTKSSKDLIFKFIFPKLFKNNWIILQFIFSLIFKFVADDLLSFGKIKEKSVKLGNLFCKISILLIWLLQLIINLSIVVFSPTISDIL